MELTQIQTISEKINRNVGKVIIGKSDIVDYIITAVISGGHLLLEDTPGTGKTMLAKSLAKSIDGDFSRIQFTPDLLPSDITGLNIFNQQTHSFEFIKGPVFTNILLADEINRATPRTQSSLLECMEEKQVTVDGETRVLDQPFLVIATQNPIETAGTYALPEAQLDRFTMQLSLGLPTEMEELSIIDRFIGKNPYDELFPVCTKNEIVEMRQASSSVFVHDCIRKYIVDIIQATRSDASIACGVSPRGTLAFVKTAQVYAAIKGRSYVIPEDIKKLAVPVLAHRIITYSNIAKISNKATMIETILNTIPVPTEDFSAKAES